ncbi:hypothetical protein PR048_013106 [Dryococelus australis]|uniref:PiggyBac transposable element-derived protein domain-containing protein n=1 Tax=Dryococelus australis TaxID=614101 RepID=A0ABQ9HR93_9NEOP|nr:hypothetical protein PR048_013106 [Dryococelus australis]
MPSTSTPKWHKTDRQHCGKILDSDLGLNTEDYMPDLPVFQEMTVVIAQLYGTSTPLDYFSVFMPLEIMNDCWSKYSILHIPFPASIMSRDCFKALLSYLHISYTEQYIPSSQPNHDPLFKICPFFDHLYFAFSSPFATFVNLMVDQDKYGIKLFVVCDAYSGFVLRIEAYSRKGAEEPGVMALLKRLLDSYFEKGFTVHMDCY